MNERLHELARLSGVILAYHDIWGHLHQVSTGTLRSILGAMNIDAKDDAAVERAIATAHRDRWCEILPPAAVVRAGRSPWTLRLTTDADLGETTLRWTLREENGTVHTAEFVPSALDPIESAEIDDTRRTARALRFDVDLPCGYHHLSVSRESAVLAESLFCVAPARCYSPPAIRDEGRVWGVAAQLYAVRSDRNWGIGDFTDLIALIEQWGTRGAAVVGLNPLHALYPHNPAHCSPYSPSSRLFKNWIYLDIEACPDFAECEEARALVASVAFQARLRELRATELVDYRGVAAAKREVVELLHAHFCRRHLAVNTERGSAFRTFQTTGGIALRRHATFEALQVHLSRDHPGLWGWQAWPEAYRDPASPMVERFCAAHVTSVEFFEYLQWQIDEQLGAAARVAHAVAPGIGIYQDLAVSIDRAGAEIWANQAVYGIVASVGCPPDDFNLQGQDWGLPPAIPQRLRQCRYAPFIATLRANMRHSGALRLDHVMGLMRLFWVPPEGKATDGAYVLYPFEDLLGLLALESERNRCLIIGEDLGTVPDEVRDALREAGVLSYRLLYFEHRHDGEFKSAHEYSGHAIVAATTHDLPTLAGWWEGRDIELRTRLALYPNDALRESQIAGRAADRARLLRALQREGLLDEGTSIEPSTHPTLTAPLLRGAQTLLAASPAKVMVVQLEDVLGAPDQVNLPGTTDAYPNWRRKLPATIAQLGEDESFRALTAALTRARP